MLTSNERNDILKKLVRRNLVSKGRETTLLEVSVSFLNTYRIFRALFSATRPIEIYFGYCLKKDIIELTGQPDKFMKLAEQDNVVLQTDEATIEYLRVFLEVTHERPGIFYIVESIDDIRFKPGLTKDEEIEKERVIDDIRTKIHPISINRDEQYYNLEYFIINNQQLEERRSRLTFDGRMSTNKTIVAPKLPTVYVL